MKSTMLLISVLVYCGTLLVLSDADNDTLYDNQTLYADYYYYEDDGVSGLEYVISKLNNSDSYAFEIIHELCPDLNTCFGDHNDIPRDMNVSTDHCCLPCECSNDCFATGSCCHDKELLRSNKPDDGVFTEDGETCSSPYLLGEWDSAVNKDDFLMIQKCSEQINTNSSDATFRCLNPSETDADEMTPVTSNSTGKSYVNKFCALCNDDGEHIDAWTPLVSCESQTNISDELLQPNIDKNRAFQIIREADCTVVWIPPRKASFKYCIKQRISKCRYTDNSLVHRLCEQDGPYIPIPGHSGVYRNVFCLICNEKVTLRQMLQCVPGNSPNSFYAGIFTSLLDLSVYTRHPEAEVDDNSQCEVGFKYINNLRRCLEVRCPITQNRIGNACHSIMSSIAGITFQYKVNVIFSMEDLQHVPPISLITGVAMKVIFEDHQLDAWVCAETTEWVIVEGASVAQVSFGKHVTGLTDVQESYKYYERRIREENTLYEHNASTMYRLEAGDDIFTPLPPDKIKFASYENYPTYLSCPGDSVAMSKRQWCQNVVVQEYEEIPDGGIVVNGSTFSAYELIRLADTDAVYICLETFVDRIVSDARLAGGHGLHTVTGLQSIIYGLVLYVCFTTISF